jgi:ParB family chromosome partitioning protein
MNIVTLDLDTIDDSKRLRPVDPIYVSILAESIDENGQMTPIEVRPAGKNGMYRLIAGAHRVAAIRQLEQKTVAATIFEGSDNEADLREIDENLCRHDLNDLDRAIFLGKRKEAYDRLHPQAKFGKDEGNQDVAKMATVLRFTLETARNLKLAERTIQRLVHRYEHLEPTVRDRLRGTWLASMGSELDALARLNPEEQVKVVEMLLREADPQPNVAAAKIAVRGIRMKPRTTADEECSKLIALWKRTGREGRAAFREFLTKPESRKAGVVAGE